MFFRRIDNKIRTTIFVLQLTAVGFGSATDSLRLEVLLNSQLLGDTTIKAPFINSLAITPDRLVLLSTTDRFYLLGWGGIAPLGKKVEGPVGSYAYTANGLLMVIRNSELCVFDSLGNLSCLFKLPNAGMGICAGEYGMYVFDNSDTALPSHSLYVIAKGGNYAKLFEVPDPVTAVVEMKEVLLFATGNGLFRFNPASRELKALVALNKGGAIRSIAVDGPNRQVYFSTDSTVCALKDSLAVVLSDNSGGILNYFDGGLLVFNPEKKTVVRIAGIDTKLAAVMKPVAKDNRPVGSAKRVVTIHRAGGLSAAAPKVPANSAWEQLYASSWLYGKSAEAAAKGDLEEADFLSGQALLAATGVRLKVTVPSSPPPPPMFGVPENALVYKEFIIAMNEQTKKVVEASGAMKKTAEKRKEAEAAAARIEKRLEAIRAGNSTDSAEVIGAQQALEQSKQGLTTALQEEAMAKQRKVQEIKMSSELNKMNTRALNDPVYAERFSKK